jgi:single-strand DNA-binding protein
MSTFNRVLLMGHLGNDPVLKSASNGEAFCRLNLATDSFDPKAESKKRTNWHSIHVFGKQAEAAAQYLAKGRRVLVEGRMQSTVTGEGNDRTWRNWIKVDRLMFLSGQEAEQTPEPQNENSDVSADGDIVH